MRHAEDATCSDSAFERDELAGDVALGDGVKRAQVAGVFAAGRGGLLDLDGEQRAVSLHEDVYLAPVVVAEEVQGRPDARVDEALVHLAEGVCLEELPGHRARLKDGGACPAGEVRRQARVQEVQDGLLGQPFEQVVRVGLYDFHDI